MGYALGRRDARVGDMNVSRSGSRCPTTGAPECERGSICECRILLDWMPGWEVRSRLSAAHSGKATVLAALDALTADGIPYADARRLIDDTLTRASADGDVSSPPNSCPSDPPLHT